MAHSRIAGRACRERSSGRVSALVGHLAGAVRHAMCGLHGHLWVLHSTPGHLSLQCFACGAQTRGWTIDVRPQFRPLPPPRARVGQRAHEQPPAIRPLRPAA
jgi:hypothetical protein